jgi:hypothetical protein
MRKLLFAAALLVACAPAEPAIHPVVSKAQFDLSCPRDQLTYLEIDEKTFGVRGCGKQTKYVEICRVTRAFPGEECQWIQN